jgi:Family of unknown function (DUF5996)
MASSTTSIVSADENMAAARPGGDAIQAGGYSHECISAGFRPGNGDYGQAALYSYAAPAREGLSETVLSGQDSFDKKLGEFILNYDDARQSPKSRPGGPEYS